MIRHTDVGNMSIYFGPNIDNVGASASDLDYGSLWDGAGNGGGEKATEGKEHAEEPHFEGWVCILTRSRKACRDKSWV